MISRYKRITALALSLTMTISLAGCKSSDAKEMVEAIDQGIVAELSVAEPSTYTIAVSGSTKELVVWTRLDQLKTYNMGFRQGVDEIFNTNIIMDTEDSVGGKQSCLYVINQDGIDVRSGNTTISDAFRNKQFVEKYWNNQSIRTELNKLVTETYTDVGVNSSLAIEAVLNAYFNLLDTASDTEAFNGYQALSREEFYAFLVRATQPVTELEENTAYTQMLGSTATDYSILAGQVEGYNFINVANGGLTSTNVHEPISRLEAIYMIVKIHFPELFEKATKESKAFNDTIYGGDIALSIGFKEEAKGGNETTLVEKNLWELYTLSYMLTHPDKAMQDELYRAMAVAKQTGLVGGTTSRWNEAVSKEEAIDFIISMNLAKNDLYGYATTTEYAKMAAEEYNEVIMDDLNDDTILYDLASLPGELLMKFKEVWDSENIDKTQYERDHDLILAQLEELVKVCERDNVLMPESYDLAFREWRKPYARGWVEEQDALENIDGEESTGKDTTGEDAAAEDVAGEDVVGEDTASEDVAGGAENTDGGTSEVSGETAEEQTGNNETTEPTEETDDRKTIDELLESLKGS